MLTRKTGPGRRPDRAALAASEVRRDLLATGIAGIAAGTGEGPAPRLKGTDAA